MGRLGTGQAARLPPCAKALPVQIESGPSCWSGPRPGLGWPGLPTRAKKKDTTMSQMTSLVKAEKACRMGAWVQAGTCGTSGIQTPAM